VKREQHVLADVGDERRLARQFYFGTGCR
jgi:hypothetical protein